MVDGLHIATTTLTGDERHDLEHAIGVGLCEIGNFDGNDPVVVACWKLGLRPRDWHGALVIPARPAYLGGEPDVGE